MTATEDEAASVVGAEILAFGYRDGCIVLALDDGREVRFGAELHRSFPMVEHITNTGDLRKLYAHLEKMRLQMDRVQFRINDLTLP